MFTFFLISKHKQLGINTAMPQCLQTNKQLVILSRTKNKRTKQTMPRITLKRLGDANKQQAGNTPFTSYRRTNKHEHFQTPPWHKQSVQTATNKQTNKQQI